MRRKNKPKWKPENIEAFKKLMKVTPKPGPPTFLGFRINTNNVNRLWDWRTLEDIKL